VQTHRAALAIDNADLYSQTRRVGSVLQAMLLPEDLPDLAASSPIAGRRSTGWGGAPRPSPLTFGRGDVLLPYTDGLIERRGESIDIGLKRLQSAAAELLTAVTDETDLHDVIAQLFEAVSHPDRHDDVAVLGFRRTS
jgi:hypothetical protein